MSISYDSRIARNDGVERAAQVMRTLYELQICPCVIKKCRCTLRELTNHEG